MNRTTMMRNLIIFVIVTLGCGWLGIWLDQQIPSPDPGQSPGILVWLVAPLLTVLILRGLGKDGWADFGLRLNLKGNWGWYAVALLVYPVTIALTLGLGAVFGAASFEGLMSRGAGALLPVIAFGLASSLIKNIAEEFSWRGYLTPRLKSLGLNNITNHLLTGLVWGLWHIPYWLFFLGADVINDYTSLGMTWFVVLGLIGIFPLAIVFGELRLKTGSVWPAFLAHCMTNAISAQLIVEGFVEFKPGTELFFSPASDGIVMMALFLALGLWMLRNRKSA